MEFKITKLLAPLLFLVLPVLVQAQLIFTTNSGAITITGYNGPAGAVVIPATTNGYPVTGIGDYAFAYSSLTSVAIPTGVTNILDSAFLSCTNLTNITVDASNPVYSSLNGVLFDKTHVTLLQLPGGLGGGYTVPNSVTNIELEAFFGCTSLTSVTIPDSVTRIELGLFQSFFPHCANLTNITVDASNPVYSSLNGVLFDRAQETLYRFPGGLDGGYVIPDSVTSILGFAFFECTGLTNVTIPNSVADIGVEAFGRSGLTSVTIPDSVTRIDSGALYDCTNLANISVDASNPVYSSLSGVLFDKAQVTLLCFPPGQGGSYAIPNSVTNIGYGAFEFAGLTNVTIASGVTNIEDYAFFECARLTSVTIPNSVTRLGDHAFEACSGLTSVTIPNSVVSIGYRAFSECASLKTAYFQGNAPPDNGNAFDVARTVVYYLPGTTGWGSTFGGVPAVLWNPQARILGFTGGLFGFNLTGPAGAVVVVEGCTNLSNPVWLTLATNTIPGSGTSTFSDSESYSLASRLYRFRSP